jgi:hypothetical protein
MFIIGLASNVICVLLIITMLRVWFNNEDFETVGKQLNLGTDNSHAFKLFMWSLYVWLGVVVLSFVLVPLVVLIPFIKLASYVLAWYWVYESYQNGFITKWVAEIKEKINK